MSDAGDGRPETEDRRPRTEDGRPETEAEGNCPKSREPKAIREPKTEEKN